MSAPRIEVPARCLAPAGAARRQTGMSLIELMITVGILALLILAAAPSIRGFLGNTQVRTAIESVQSGLQLARNNALRRSETYQLVYASGVWSVMRKATGVAEFTSGTDLRATTVTPSTFTIEFDPLGRASDNVGQISASGVFAATISNPGYGACQTASGNVRCLTVQLRSGGSSRVCDPQLAVATDPRGC